MMTLCWGCSSTTVRAQYTTSGRAQSSSVSTSQRCPPAENVEKMLSTLPGS